MPKPYKYYTPIERFTTSSGSTLHPGLPVRYCGQMIDRVQLRDDDGTYYHVSLSQFDEKMRLLPSSEYRAFKRGQRLANQTIEFCFVRPMRFAKRCVEGFFRMLGALIEGILEGLGSLFD